MINTYLSVSTRAHGPSLVCQVLHSSYLFHLCSQLASCRHFITDTPLLRKGDEVPVNKDY